MKRITFGYWVTLASLVGLAVFCVDEMKQTGILESVHAFVERNLDAALASQRKLDMALGKALFYDVSLSASGTLACATCHDPAHAFAQANALPVQRGGARGDVPGFRAVPSLRYMDDVPFHFSAAEPGKEPEPAGGFNLDGRADTLEAQARRPLFAPHEMANASVGDFAARLAHSPSADLLRDRFGPDIFNNQQGVLNVATQAIAAYERSAGEFHPYSSKYDRVLRHEATLTPSEAHGMDVFNDKKKGNCASCHTSRISEDATPPAFTNRTYDSLGLPRNMAIPANAKPTYFDQGLCGPFRTDLVNNKESCGQFKVPTLRNVATRQVFFHNAAFTSLHDAVTFYAQRDIHPENYYPKGPDGQVQKFNDSPPFAGSTANRTDVPYDRNPGDEPAMNAQDIDDVVAFLETLTDADSPSLASNQ